MCGLSLNRAKDFSYAKHDPILDFRLAIVDTSFEPNFSRALVAWKRARLELVS
jgi:hypothetical protein